MCHLVRTLMAIHQHNTRTSTFTNSTNLKHSQDVQGIKNWSQLELTLPLVSSTYPLLTALDADDSPVPYLTENQDDHEDQLRPYTADTKVSSHNRLI